MGFLEQLLGKSEYKTCEMEINFAMEEGDEESGYIIAEIFGEEVIGWNKYIHALCSFKEDSELWDYDYTYVELIKTANRFPEVTIPVLFQLKGGKVTDMRVDFITYSNRVNDERFAELRLKAYHVMNIKSAFDRRSKEPRL